MRASSIATILLVVVVLSFGMVAEAFAGSAELRRFEPLASYWPQTGGTASILRTVTADFTGDGHEDVVFASGEGVLSVLSGGAGGYARADNLALPGGSISALGRLPGPRGDGAELFAVSGNSLSLIATHPLRIVKSLAFPIPVCDAQAGDLDADGAAELVVQYGCESGELIVFDLETGAELRRLTQHAPFLLTQWDDDPALEIVAGRGPIQVIDGATGSIQASAGDASERVYALQLASVDADPEPELVVNRGGRTDILQVPSLALQSSLPPTSSPLVVADVDRNGINDITFSDRRVTTLDAVTGAVITQYLVGINSCHSLAVADLDGVGPREIVCAQGGPSLDHALKVIEPDPESPREVWTEEPRRGPFRPVIEADMDGDGTIELVVTSESGGTIVLDRDSLREKWSTRGADDVAVGQFDSDPALEIAIQGKPTMTIIDGATHESQKDFFIDSPLGTAKLMAFDANGDGALDVVRFFDASNVAYIDAVDPRTGMLLWSTSVTPFSSGGYTPDFAIGDYDFDGSVEFVVTSLAGTVAVDPRTRATKWTWNQPALTLDPIAHGSAGPELVATSLTGPPLVFDARTRQELGVLKAPSGARIQSVDGTEHRVLASGGETLQLLDAASDGLGRLGGTGPLGTHVGTRRSVLIGARADGTPVVTVGSDAGVRRFALTPSCCLRTQHGLTGAWYEPATAGQGFNLELFPGTGQSAGLFAGGWFTYADDTPGGGAERQRWYYVQGPAGPAADTAALTIYQNIGGRFAAPPATTATAIGSATLRLISCSRADLEYAFEDGSARSGTIALQRLLPANSECDESGAPLPSPDFDFSGNWYDPALPGQGFVFGLVSDPFAGSLFATWYTYAKDGSNGADGQRWYTLQTAMTPGTRTFANVFIRSTTGGRFDQPPTDALRGAYVGKATIEFLSCERARVSYTFTSGENTGAAGTIELRRVGPTPTGCAF